jgi:hypothetical protein
MAPALSGPITELLRSILGLAKWMVIPISCCDKYRKLGPTNDRPNS